MPPAPELPGLKLIFHCPHCGFPVVGTSLQLRIAPHLICDECGRSIMRGYPSDILPFERHRPSQHIGMN